jgi:hypothetical protein
MFWNSKFQYLLTLIAISSLGSSERPHTFSLPNSVLLFGGSWSAEVVTPATLEAIPLPQRPRKSKGPSAIPTLDSTGSLVGSGFPVTNENRDDQKLDCAVALYSREDKSWRTYGRFRQIYMSAISPTRSQTAFIADEAAYDSRGVFLLNVETGEISKLLKISAVWASWSPDGQKLAIGTAGGETEPRVTILDIASRHVEDLARGTFPAWSPSGKWVAYLDSLNQSVHLIQPNGTDDHKVVDVSGKGLASFGLAPVWSPDERELMLNQYKGSNLESRDVILLDLATGKTTTKLHNGDAIFGWARVR